MSLPFWIGVLVTLLAIMLFSLLKQNSLFKNNLGESESLLRQLLEIEKYERKKIHAELHDKLQGDLIAVKNFIYVGKQLKDESEREIINSKIQESLGDAINNAKRLSYKINPPLLDTDTLADVAENYFTSGKNLKDEYFDIKIKESGFFLPIDKNHELFRVIQELHHNAIYHGRANAFSLLFHQDENFISLNLRTMEKASTIIVVYWNQKETD